MSHRKQVHHDGKSYWVVPEVKVRSCAHCVFRAGGEKEDQCDNAKAALKCNDHHTVFLPMKNKYFNEYINHRTTVKLGLSHPADDD